MVLLIGLGGCGEAPSGPPPPAPPAVCGQEDPPSWDDDGDGISDSIEQVNDAFRDSVCDTDPSRAHGTYAEGSLESGLYLPGGGGEYGYESVALDASRPDTRWGTLELLSCIERVGREVRAKYRREFYVTDLSTEKGGPFDDQIPTHQNGLEVDVFYPRRDGKKEALHIVDDGKLLKDQRQYDPIMTRRVMEAFHKQCKVETIFAVDFATLGFAVEEGALELSANLTEHAGHFTVRLVNPWADDVSP